MHEPLSTSICHYGKLLHVAEGFSTALLKTFEAIGDGHILALVLILHVQSTYEQAAKVKLRS